MTRLRPSYLAALALILALGITATAHAGPAQDFVRSKHTSLITELKKPRSPARQKSVDVLLNGFFDYEKLTKDALAKHYDDLSQDEYEELRTLLQALVTKNYRKHIEKTMDYEVNFLGDDDARAGKVVRTKVQKKGASDAPVEVNYYLHQKAGTWLVYDIETDGSSMLRNYRNQFGKIIRKDGFGALLERLQKRLDEP